MGTKGVRGTPWGQSAAPLKKEYAILFHASDEELVWKLAKHLHSSATLITCSGTLSEVKDKGFSRARRLIIFPSDKFLTELRVKKDQWWDLVENSEEYRQGNVIIVFASTIKEHFGFSYPSDALRIIREVESGDIGLAVEKFTIQLKRQIDYELEVKMDTINIPWERFWRPDKEGVNLEGPYLSDPASDFNQWGQAVNCGVVDKPTMLICCL